MATVYRWAGVARPVWADMLTTTLFNDGSAGDAGTGEATSATDNAVGSCFGVAADSVMTAQAALGTVHSVTGATFKGTLTGSRELSSEDCLDPSPASSASWALEGTTDGATWATLGGGSLTPVDLSFTGTATPQPFSITSTFTAAQACMVRLVILHNQSRPLTGASMTSGIGVTDFRFTATDTGTACSSEGGGNGDGGGGDTGGGGGGGEDECPCDWTVVSTDCAVWVGQSAPTGEVVHWEDGQELFPFTPRGVF